MRCKAKLIILCVVFFLVSVLTILISSCGFNSVLFDQGDSLDSLIYFYGPVDHVVGDTYIWCGKTIHGETRLITAWIDDGVAVEPPFIQYGYIGGCEQALEDLNVPSND